MDNPQSRITLFVDRQEITTAVEFIPMQLDSHTANNKSPCLRWRLRQARSPKSPAHKKGDESTPPFDLKTKFLTKF
jgi:hypothetical protein